MWVRIRSKGVGVIPMSLEKSDTFTSPRTPLNKGGVLIRPVAYAWENSISLACWTFFPNFSERAKGKFFILSLDFYSLK